MIALTCWDASAMMICAPEGDSRTHVTCLSEDIFHDWIGEHAERNLGSKVRSHEFGYLLNEVRAILDFGHDDVLVIDYDYTFRRNRLVADIPGEILQLVNQLPPVSDEGLARRQSIQASIESSSANDTPSVHEQGGIDPDGQYLYGRPDGNASWGCTGYGSTDTCKACCMTTRSAMFTAVGAFAAKCHTSANACAGLFGVGIAWCHAGCAIAEAAMVAAILYSMSECNNNCEHVYWSDTSIDWGGAPAEHQLYWDGAAECLGWAKADSIWWGDRRDALEINGGEYISIPGIKFVTDINSGLLAVNCVVLAGNEAHEEVDALVGNRLRIMGNEVPCPPPLYPDGIPRGDELLVEGNHAGIRCFDAADYRVVDINRNASYDQTPFVGIIRRSGNSLYFNRGEGERLYLDGLDSWMYDGWFSTGYKIWAYGSKSGNRLHVSRFDYIWYVGS